MRRAKRYPSDAAPRCNVCRKKLPPGCFGRCYSHPPPNNSGKCRDYKEFMQLPIPEEGASHSEIATAMGVTAERVRQIEAGALRKLALNARALKLFRGE